MKKLLITAAAFVAFTTSAIADVILVKSEPIYTSKPITEQVQVVKKGRTQGFDLGGAILGGIIGNNIGKAGKNTGAGAVIGGLIGGQGTEDRIVTETRIVGYEQVVTGYTLTLDVDGVTKVIRINK